MSRSLRACSVLLALAFLTPARAADVPFLTGRVVDNAEILQPATRSRLTIALRAHEQRTTDQVVVLTVPTIGDESVEEYATKVFETWKLGVKGKDNGVLIVIVPQDRKMRIEVGYGLEGTLTDAASSRIIRNLMTPPFKAGNYDKGVEDGVTAVLAQLQGQADVAPDVAAATHDTRSSSNGFSTPLAWPMRILLGAFIFGIIGLFTFMGVMTPGFGGWFLYVFLVPFWAMFPVVILGMKVSLVVFAAYLVGFPGREAAGGAHRLVRQGGRGSEVEGQSEHRRLHGDGGRILRRRLLGRRRRRSPAAAAVQAGAEAQAAGKRVGPWRTAALQGANPQIVGIAILFLYYNDDIIKGSALGEASCGT